MSTGVLTPPNKPEEQWWEITDDESTEVSAPPPVAAGKLGISRRRAFAMLENALDQADLDWDERRVIDKILASSPFVAAIERLPQEEAYELIGQWENETARVGSVEASKRSNAYEQLLALSSDAVIAASLKRLRHGASPHVLTLLEEVVGAAPAATETTVAGAARAWLDWGHRQNLL